MVYILEQYISTFVLFLLGMAVVLAVLAINRLTAPSRKPENRIEGLHAFIAYECGEVPIGEAHSRFNFQYYVFALVFVVFDVVASLLIVWSIIVNNQDIKVPSSISVGLFLGTFSVGFLYWWIRKALRWM